MSYTMSVSHIPSVVFQKNVAVLFLTLLLAESSWSLDEDTHKIAASQQNERDRQEPENTHTLSRVKRQFGYGYYGVPYYGLCKFF